VREFLDELKTDAAYAEVASFPYAGADLLGMLERHGLATNLEIEGLIADARARVPEDDPEPDEDPEAADMRSRPGNGFGRPALKHDDEIPF
jgi:hypothetical protein